MRNIFIISDTHFNHANILKFVGYDGKPVRPGFSSVEEMNETMIENWNKTVKEGDIVYHLGDVYFGNKDAADVTLYRLNGSKRLILGNHDDMSHKVSGESVGVLQRHFQKVMVERYFKDFKIHLSHYPMHHESIKGERNVHGHIHQNLIDDERYVNACVEHRNYTPVSIEEI